MLFIRIPVLRAHFRCRDLEVQSLLTPLAFARCQLDTLTCNCALVIMSCFARDWFHMQVLRPLPQVAGTMRQQYQSCVFAPEGQIFLCLEAGSLLGQRNLCAWSDSMFFLSHPLTATAGSRIMSYTNLCNTMQCHSCATLPTRCGEHTYHGPGFNPRFHATKNDALQQLASNHLLDLIFVQSCP